MSESLSAEAIKEIERLVHDGQRAQFRHVEGDPDHVLRVTGPDGLLKTEHREPEPLSVKLATPEAFGAFATERKGDDSEVYYNEKFIALVLDRHTRRDLASCPLAPSPQYAWLADRGGQAALTQKDFVRLLRIQFRGCLPEESNLLGIVRQLRFDGAAAVTGNVQHAKESLGRSITNSVTGEGAIPEEVTLTVPVFANWGFRTNVVCAVEVLPQEQQFRLTPYPLEVRRAMEEAMAALADLLADTGSPVFYGSPGEGS